ncbi:MAG TPA: HEAT repeat domain-containing protein [Verrucomicrobiae bacterium]|nr:HEAT repeat domain-containing protein [Verrucomicrobiae bacterium]
MEKKRAIWLGFALLLIAVGLSWYISRSREPTYQGKPLTYWLELLNTDDGRLVDPADNSAREAEHAVQAIGTNAIPTLLEMLQKKDSPLKSGLIALSTKEHFLHINIFPDSYYHALAFDGFGALGTNGRQAVPALLKIFRSSDQRPGAAMCLRLIGPAAESAVAALVHSLAVDTNYADKLYIISALGDIHAHPEMAVPALTNCLADSNKMVRDFAIMALGNFGTNAAQAIPILETKLNDNDPETRQEVLKSLKQIDPQIANQFQTNHAASPR